MTINLEMMKQLLQEFEEKEALTAEEIKAIDEQKKELEKRIESCKSKLALVSEDRMKIEEMRKRYAEESNGSDHVASNIGNANSGALVKPINQAPVLKERTDQQSAIGQTQSKDFSTFFEETQAASSKTDSQPSKVASASAADAKPSDSAAGDSSEEGKKEKDDTVKSINDALRSLFR